MLNYKFRLYPNKHKKEKLLYALELCRQTYNTLLGELNKQQIMDKAQIQGVIPDMKICDPELKKVYSKTLQYECYRLFSNLKTLSQLKKKGKKVGKLRFKGKGWFHSFTYNQSGFKIKLTGKRCQTLHLSKIGDIPIRVHRNVKGKVKQITIKKYNSGKWFAFVSVETQEKVEKKPVKRVVGIDVGTNHFVTDSGGVYTEHPFFLKKSLKKLAREQRKLAKKNKGSNNRAKQRIKVASVYEKVMNQRGNFLHQLSRIYVNAYDCIVVEDLDIKGLISISYNARNILDASWNKLIQMMSYKASRAGKTLIKVSPRGTTQRCSKCGKTVEKTVWVRTHKCSHCGLEIDRDYNSAIEIRNLGLQKVGQELPDFKPVERKPLLRSGASFLKEAGSVFQNH